MLDFLVISTRTPKRGVVEIYPKFKIMKSSDLMIRGGDFYAIWVEERGLWSTDEEDVVRLIDRELDKYAKENRDKFDAHVKVLYMWDSESGMIDAWHRYCQKQLRDYNQPLDNNLTFANQETKKEDFATKKLPYPLEAGSIDAYDKLMSTLYDPEERHKIEWSIGSIVTGESKTIEKFLVIYGPPGTGKGTIMNNIILELFKGYHTVFDAKALGSSSNQFALEMFRNNPLVALQLDGDLSRIEDNTRLNSLVSHEEMQVNVKYTKGYPAIFRCFLIMATNKHVKITDSNSGLIRRLIDAYPSGRKISPGEYKKIVKQLKFELGAIAYHCREVYLADRHKYDSYEPLAMMGATNDFYNFMLDSYFVFKKDNSTTLKAAWEMYKTYCDEANIQHPLPRRVFQEELKNYFADCIERYILEDGTRVRNYYTGFLVDKFEKKETELIEEPKTNHIQFNSTKSIFDKECAGCFAQYATDKETPTKKWDEVTTKLSELDTTKLHYVKVPENHIVIDFDIPDENGKKCFEKNLEAASHWPATYAELSKSGAGIHLHYIYTGDVTKLSRVHDEHIEVKVFTGKSSLRRKLSKCNNLPIATISSGLALKGEDKLVNTEVIKSEKGLRALIKRNLNKEIHPGTKPSIDFIYKILEDAYNDGMIYDVTDMRNAVLAFAAKSTNQSDYCIKLVNKMRFKSLEQAQGANNDDAKLVFYDVEVFPNLFLVNWKVEGPDQKVVRMINPRPVDIEALLQFRLVGFNCRRYDNHILYGRLMGYTNEQLYKLSQRIIGGDKNAFFSEAYNASYTDIYDFASKKQSLKKWEIELGIHHQELGLPWDQPVPEEKWIQVAEYCDNDVIATEAVWNHKPIQADFLARKILADLAGGTVNDTTNSLTTKIIFGNNKNPQDQFNYRNMGDIRSNETYYDINGNPITSLDIFDLTDERNNIYEVFNKEGKPMFPGYKFDRGRSLYRGEDPKEGGYVYAEQGMYTHVALLDIASMHPHSVIAEVLFGEKFTAKFKEIVDGRVSIKHEDWEAVNQMLDGKLTPYVQKVKNGELTSKDLANALKIAINSVYGLTSANFENPFRDPRNKDNIVAKRGALFMINLKHAVQERGFTVAHIKTDSIKIPNATPEIIEFVMWYGKKYGYTFEHEATYDRMCLVNDAVYISKDAATNEWDATGTQFAVPYVFKKLFSKEEIEFDDLCETKSVAKGELYLDMNENLPDVSEYEELIALRTKQGKLTRREESLLEKYQECTDEEIEAEIAKGHNYIFVGRVGQFCPIKEGKGGGVLYRIHDGKKYAATGTKGYRWLESEVVKTLGKEADIDRSYYDALVDASAHDISQYGDLEWFISDDSRN